MVAKRLTPALEGSLDLPLPSETVDRSLCHVHGWALAKCGLLDRIEIYVDGRLAGLARLGLPRSDVAGIRSAPEAAVCGFDSYLDLSDIPTNVSTVSIGARAYDAIGNAFSMPARTVLLRSSPSHAALRIQPQGINKIRGSTLAPPLHERRLRIACFTHDLGYGGGQLYLSELLRRMVQLTNAHFTVVSPIDGPLRKELEAIGIEVAILSIPLIRDSTLFTTAMSDLARWLSACQFDALIGNTLLAFGSIIAAHMADIPSIWAIHESYPLPLWCSMSGSETDLAQVPYLVEKIEAALRCASMVVFEAEATRKLYLRHGYPQTLVTIPYGVNTEQVDAFLATFDQAATRRELGIRHSDRLVLSMGTVEPRKQQTVLAQAFAYTLHRHPDAILAIVGDFPSAYSEGLHAYIDRAGIQDKVKILPITSHPFKWYASSNIFTLCSDIESMPRSILESMAFGVPAIATSVFGIPDLIEDGNTGFLVEVNRLSRLAQRMDRLFSLNEDEIGAIGARARDHVRNSHDSTRYAHAYLKLIDTLVQKTGDTERWQVATSG